MGLLQATSAEICVDRRLREGAFSCSTASFLGHVAQSIAVENALPCSSAKCRRWSHCCLNLAESEIPGRRSITTSTSPNHSAVWCGSKRTAFATLNEGISAARQSFGAAGLLLLRGAGIRALPCRSGVSCRGDSATWVHQGSGCNGLTGFLRSIVSKTSAIGFSSKSRPQSTFIR